MKKEAKIRKKKPLGPLHARRTKIEDLKYRLELSTRMNESMNTELNEARTQLTKLRTYELAQNLTCPCDDLVKELESSMAEAQAHGRSIAYLVMNFSDYKRISGARTYPTRVHFKGAPVTISEAIKPNKGLIIFHPRDKERGVWQQMGT